MTRLAVSSAPSTLRSWGGAQAIALRTPNVRIFDEPEADIPAAEQLSLEQMNGLSDEDLLSRYLDHQDQQSFEMLTQRYTPELFAYLRKYLGNREVAEDVLQATWLQVHIKGETFKRIEKVRPWLYTVARNQAIDAQRRWNCRRMYSFSQLSPHSERQGGDESLSPELAVPDRGQPPEISLSQKESNERIHAVVDALPDEFRTVVSLVYFQGLKYREVAETLDIPLGTVKSRLHIAKKKIGEKFKQFPDLVRSSAEA